MNFSHVLVRRTPLASPAFLALQCSEKRIFAFKMFNNEIDFQLYPQLCIQSKTISRELQCRDSNQANIRSMPFIAISNSKRENEMKGLVRRCNEEVVVYRGGACGYFVCGGSTAYHAAGCSLSITLSAIELLLWFHT